MRTFTKITEDATALTVNATSPSDRRVVMTYSIPGVEQRLAIGLFPTEALRLAEALIERALVLLGEDGRYEINDAYEPEPSNTR